MPKRERDPKEGDKIVGFIDIGTNSVRLLAARIHADGTFRILSRQKQAVRLGQGTISGVLSDEAIDRTVLACSRFAALARSFGADEIVAVATSATREAPNKSELLARLRREAGIDVRVISGPEEARIIAAGIIRLHALPDFPTLLVDIGGGSTEVSVVDVTGCRFVSSMPMGAIRLTERFFPQGTDRPVSGKKYREMYDTVRKELAGVLQELRGFTIENAIGSSGTVQNLGEIAARLEGRVEETEAADRRKKSRTQDTANQKERPGYPGILAPGESSGYADSGSPGERPDDRQPMRLKEGPGYPGNLPTGEPQFNEPSFSLDELRRTVELLLSVSLEERKKIPGINPDRADIIVAGAVVLEVIMAELAVSRISVTGLGLREGMLADYLTGMGENTLETAGSPRIQGVMRLAGSCGASESHGRKVAGLALDLFDSAREAGLHVLGNKERDLLDYAAMLHDIGSFINYRNHHAHSAYIIRNAELPGFDRGEISLMARIVGSHRKKMRAVINPEDQAVIAFPEAVLAVFLRLAEGLDRSHSGVVRHATIRKSGEDVLLELTADGDCTFELYGVERERKQFLKVFGKRLSVTVKKTPPIYLSS